jgi:ABC-type glutathione transport system ATPase component
MSNLVALTNIDYSVSELSLAGRKTNDILKNISINLPENSITGIIGESGSGKTTLAKILAGIIQPVKGEILLKKGMNIQLLFQNSEELVHPLRSVESILKDVSSDKSEIEKVCLLTGIDNDIYKRKGITLSGGERQRAGLARILLNRPDLIILDEPFSAQDPDSQNNFTNLFMEINQKLGTSLLIISHNLTPLKGFAGIIYVMHKGRIVESGNTDELFASPLHPYTKFLLEAESFSIIREEIGKIEFSDSASCSFYGLCNRRIESCGSSVLKYYKNDRMALCNNHIAGEGINE